MRVLVQRVTRASVSVDGAICGQIGAGWCALVGVTHTDTEDVAAALARKLWELRALPDEAGMMNRSMAQEGSGEVLVISQFTLYGDTNNGRRPSWGAAAPGAVAEPLVETFVHALQQLGATVATGIFGADMQVELVNDGPVTLMLEQGS